MCPRFGVLGRVLPLAMVVLACATLGLGQTAPDAGEKPFRQSAMTLVVSVRHYLASPKPSYYHLYLYSGDGKMVRQLTDVDKANDVKPVLSPDGKQLCFQRLLDDSSLYDYPQNTTGTYHLIEDVRSRTPEREIAQAPEWYRPRLQTVPRAAKPKPPEPADWRAPATLRYPSPDNACEIVVHSNWPGEQSDPNGVWGMNVTFWLTDLRTSTTQRMAQMQGFQELSGVCDGTYSTAALPDRPYLVAGPLRLAFFFCHQGSTGGSSAYAFDLNRRVFTELTPNGGFAVPAPQGVPGFFFVSGDRYQPLGYGKKTVNCEYLDFWNEKMKRTRFAPELSKFGGAALWIPGHGATVIPPHLGAQP